MYEGDEAEQTEAQIKATLMRMLEAAVARDWESFEQHAQEIVLLNAHIKKVMKE